MCSTHHRVIEQPLAVRTRALHSASSRSQGVRLAEDPVLELREQHVQPATRWTHRLRVLAFAGCPFPLEVGLRQRVTTRRRPRRMRQRVLQPLATWPRRELTTNRGLQPTPHWSNAWIRNLTLSSPQLDK